jgi:hypothetical protein
MLLHRPKLPPASVEPGIENQVAFLNSLASNVDYLKLISLAVQFPVQYTHIVCFATSDVHIDRRNHLSESNQSPPPNGSLGSMVKFTFLLHSTNRTHSWRISFLG